MKVVQINATCGYGSTGKIAVDISRILTENGVENHVFFAEKDSDYPLGIKYASDKYLKLQALKTRIFGNYGFQAKHATKKLINMLDKINPDIIHLHNLHSHNVNLSLLFRYIKRKNVKVIWTFHDCWSFTGGCTHFDYIGCEKWKSSCEKCPEWKRMSWFFDRTEELFKKKKALCSGVDLTIVVPSEWMKSLVERSFLKECPVNVINNGIDLDVFKSTESDFRQKYGLENKKVLLGVAMGFDARKGYGDFIELSKRLGEGFAIVLVGVTKEQKENLPENVIGIERTSNQIELAQIYTMADIFINLTYEDNFPTVNLEALACGTPVLTYATGGSGEIADGEVGFSVEKGNVDEVISLAEKIKKDTVLSQKCRRKAEENFSKNDCFKKYLDLYSKVEKD